MAGTLALIFTLVAGSLAGVLPIRSDTKLTNVTLPQGVTYNQNTHLLCSPTTWTDVATFFLGNYISHAATVIAFPGEPWHVVTLNMLLAILFPGMGAARGLLAIIRHAALCKDPIQRALRSRAMCMVVRSKEWRPSSGQKVHSLSFLSATLRGKKEDEEDEDFRAHNLICESMIQGSI
ncbi:pogo transposable element [Penicillium riverlandense]|uniref:pogo transposable element n=1 Tax=Penicillium riverlandense TaxID=1903569 RepID=UPI0025477C2C|nr:pogo transposable element [Penicillium riverlandense]KAJ5832209.1 pogo transposable element [Penicillium riverlandense]